MLRYATSRFVLRQFALRHPLVARIGVYALLLDAAASSLLWVQPAMSAPVASVEPQVPAPNATAWYVPDLHTALGDAVLANVVDRFERLLVPSAEARAALLRRLADVSSGAAVAAAAQKVALAPVAVNASRWRREAEAFAERGERKVRLT
jgi:hypothetical protein